MRTVDNETYYYLYNGHADVTALITGDGTIAATYYYDAFGNILESTGEVNNNILYSGYQYDEETGLYYLNARMYDPKIARFLQEDTYTGDAKDPLSLNLYTYCANNPLRYIDPTGHEYATIKSFVKDYDGSIKYGKELAGWNITITNSDGKSIIKYYKGKDKPSFLASNNTTIEYEKVYKPYADIIIGDNKERIYHVTKNNIKNLKMERTDFLDMMGMDSSQYHFSNKITESEAENVNAIIDAGIGIGITIITDGLINGLALKSIKAIRAINYTTAGASSYLLSKFYDGPIKAGTYSYDIITTQVSTTNRYSVTTTTTYITKIDDGKVVTYPAPSNFKTY